MKISWKITNQCNYQCDYCFNKNEKRHFIDNYSLIKKSLFFIRNLNKDSYSFVLLGGEPTLHKDIHSILEDISNIFSERLSKVRLITNLWMNEENLETFKKHSDFIEFFVSCHSQYINKNFYDKILYVSKNFSHTFSILYNTEHKEASDSLVTFIEENGLQKHSKLAMIKNWKEYSKEELDFIKRKNIAWNNNESLDVLKNRNHFGKMCTQNEKLLFLNENCQWRGSMCSQTKWSLLPIYLENGINISSVKCKQKECPCISNDEISKRG